MRGENAEAEMGRRVCKLGVSKSREFAIENTNADVKLWEVAADDTAPSSPLRAVLLAARPGGAQRHPHARIARMG